MNGHDRGTKEIGMITYIQLSDIHFRRYSGDAYDIDNDLRNEMIRDIRACYLANQFCTAGVIVCGDIAFSGQDSEYEYADRFLEEVTNCINVKPSCVFCVPGNHDVNQNIPKSSFLVELLQDHLEEAADQIHLDYILSKIMRDRAAAEMLLSPIQAYQKFASKYVCNIDENKLFWEHVVKLNEKYNLKLVGINSALISSAKDHASRTTERKMRIGQCQLPRRTDNTVLLTICHHPPECWKDEQYELQNKLDARVNLQLYGHKHMLRLSANKSCLTVCSGAVHPDRFEGEWIPTYNWITLDIKEDDGKEYLDIHIVPRMYDPQTNQFQDNTEIKSEERTFSLLLSEKPKISSEKEPFIQTDDSSWKKTFAYSFLKLPSVEREKILEELELPLPEDQGRQHYEIIADIIERAEKAGCVEELLHKATK